MKPLDNRHNKLQKWEARRDTFSNGNSASYTQNDTKGFAEISQAGSILYGLVRDLSVATKIAQAAKHCHLAVHNFDRAESLMSHARQRKPALVILDWDGCEAEAFKVLKEMCESADLKMVPNVGYLSSSKSIIRDEARRAGCHRVYTKTEFLHDLENLIARYAQ